MSTDDRATRFRDFVRQHEPGLHAFVARRAPAEAVDDIVQEVLVITWNRFESVETDVAPGLERAWLCGVARKVQAHHVRGETRRGAREDRSGRDRSGPAAEEASDPAAVAADRELAARILAAVRPDDRELLIGMLWDQFSIAELAVLHGVSEVALRKRWSRTQARLRTLGHLLEPDQPPLAPGADR